MVQIFPMDYFSFELFVECWMSFIRLGTAILAFVLRMKLSRR
jgi:hypothetical protein